MSVASRLLSWFPDPVLTAGKRLQTFNYEHEAIALRKRVDGVTYRSYGLLTPDDEILRYHLLTRADPGDVVVDAGANVGHYALPAAAAGCRVYAFEPDPVAFDRLARNVRANTFDAAENAAVDPHQVGLGDEPTTLDLYRFAQSTLSTYKEPSNEERQHMSETIETPIETIDGLVDAGAIEPPDHIKIDVEGFGPEVLRGAAETIERERPLIYFEPHGHDDPDRDEMLRSFFAERDYHIHEFDYPWLCIPRDSNVGDE